ncbi:HD domain-containing protein [Paenibacillus sambharensis]|uniref:bis(5'-nucleosyl)-tetraphosphatase (symmetrical) n=1 Tax=Paenibacillus sambharensis TaxID=1803190 RepID=A0A2W1L203_9BACL|nr:bis(5'-nucleosyl)-tetraphosphatase (symmetrical) YqeK [Paenibacillus sambharensis]PZD93978.1 HD domain-containing protein [Paenibacillus sambharensis]
MDRNQLMESVRAQMPEKRWNHTLGVMQTAVELARRYGVSEEQADLAAILHDVAKYWRTDKMEEVMRGNPELEPLLSQDKELWHAFVGAVVAERDYGITDPLVLDAIRYHTSGREKMTMLDKVVCLADYIEPGRDFPGVDKIREMAQDSLERALVAGFDSTLSFLIERGKRIFPLTVLARNDLIMALKEEADL